MARLSERDAQTWHALAARVGHAIEPRLRPTVLANRGPAGLRPTPVGPSLRRARAAARSLGARAEMVLRTDVRAFYPSVTPPVMFRSLVDLGVDREVASRAATMLEGWGSEGYAGLPIGPPGSALIANAVLASVDEDLEASPSLRWVDDYVIGAQRDRDVSRVLERLDLSLDRLGLERSMPKTEVVSGRAFTWPGTYLRNDLADR